MVTCMTAVDHDVLVIGYGPVGQTAAALLGRAGHDVAVFERFEDLCRLPRAAHFDGETMRTWQALGIAGTLQDDLHETTTYDWFGADGEPIMAMRLQSPGAAGWAPSYMFFQPLLEDALDALVRSTPGVEVNLGWLAESLVQRADRVEVGLRRGQETRTVSARYAIGADGANSFVRAAAGIELEDLGFAEQWLVADVRPHDPRARADYPAPAQWCDPVRPSMHTQIGRRHRRREWMLLPGEQASDFDDHGRVWELLAPEYTPADTMLVRTAVYEFRSRIAATMRAGRVLVAGDAAKTTPPFMGQGMCSGIRDVVNAAWRLDLVLRDLAPEALLEGYDRERRPHNAWVVRLSTEMGRVSCVLDPVAAAERDAALRAATESPTPLLPALGDGLIAAGRPLAGAYSVQGLVADGDHLGLFDDVAGRGFVLLSRRPAALSRERDTTLVALGVRLVALADLHDIDGRLSAWLDEHDVAAVLIRPDAYVFGAVRTAAEIPALVDDLLAGLSCPDQGADAVPTIKPKLHHVNLKTTRLQEMIDWYGAVLGTEVLHQYEMGAWISNDAANHRIALLAFPGLTEDPGRDEHAGLHHTAFEYEDFEELDDSFRRLRDEGITPAFCLDHGMTLSYYYADPDGNHVELQCDVFGDWARSSEWVRTSEDFREDPIGKFVDPAKVSAQRDAGATFAEIHTKAMAGELAPEVAPVEIPAEG
jgi:2-polyprenyl-6-methoxyphenol hydroxylase-like FAD-dependent oxidoreductase/catechol 2,3-dioxygenase-like lactoylglutathione lyase family enzyme